MRMMFLALVCLFASLLPAAAQRSDRGKTKNMALIPQAVFAMGTDGAEIEKLKTLYGVKRGELFEGEVPRHTVKLSAFYIDKYEVTNKDFEKFPKKDQTWLPGKIPAKYDNGKYLAGWKDGKYPAGEGDHPVTNVNWYAAM